MPVCIYVTQLSGLKLDSVKKQNILMVKSHFGIQNRDNSGSEFLERNYPIQTKLPRNYVTYYEGLDGGGGGLVFTIH